MGSIVDGVLSQAPTDRQKTFLTVGIVGILLIFLVVGIVYFLRQPRLVSPLSEETSDVRVIFVSPKASPFPPPSASSSGATPQ